MLTFAGRVAKRWTGKNCKEQWEKLVQTGSVVRVAATVEEIFKREMKFLADLYNTEATELHPGGAAVEEAMQKRFAMFAGTIDTEIWYNMKYCLQQAYVTEDHEKRMCEIIAYISSVLMMIRRSVVKHTVGEHNKTQTWGWSYVLAIVLKEQMIYAAREKQSFGLIQSVQSFEGEETFGFEYVEVLEAPIHNFEQFAEVLRIADIWREMFAQFHDLEAYGSLGPQRYCF